MTRRKGEYTNKHRRRDFPLDVEFVVAPGSGREHSERYAAMIAWCGERVGHDGFTTTSRHDRELERDYIQFRFKDSAIADEFRQTWGLPVHTSDNAEVYRVAELMVRRHGANAGVQADKRAKSLLSRNEHAGYATWRMVGGAIAQIQRRLDLAKSVNRDDAK